MRLYVWSNWQSGPTCKRHVVPTIHPERRCTALPYCCYFYFFLWLHHIITIIIFTPKYCFPNHIFFLVRRCLVSFQETRRQHFSLSRECKSDMKLPRNLYKFKVWLGEWTIEIQDIKVESIHCKIACWWLVESLLNLTRQANQRLSG